MRDQPANLPMAAIGGPVSKFNPPVPVRAWVCLPRQGYVQLDGVATEYSPTAGHVRYIDPNGRTGMVWLWAGAITRR